MALRRLTFRHPSEIYITRFTRFTRFTRIFPLGEYSFTGALECSYTRPGKLLVYSLLVYLPWRILVYSFTRMLVYPPLGNTRLLVTRIFPLGEYSFYSHTGILVLLAYWNTRSLALGETLVYSFTRLLVCSFTRLLAYWFARSLHLPLGGPLILLVSLRSASQPPNDYI
jgi:hypothetical protein